MGRNDQSETKIQQGKHQTLQLHVQHLAHDKTGCAPKGLGSPIPLDMQPVTHVSSLLVWFHSMPTVTLGGCATVMASPVSWHFHWNTVSTFTASSAQFDTVASQGLLARDSDSTTHLLDSDILWNYGTRFHDTFSLASFLTLKPIVYGWHFQVLQPAQDEAWFSWTIAVST